MAGGPSGIDPTQLQSMQLGAARQFIGTTGGVTSKDVGDKSADKAKAEEKALQPQQDASELSTLPSNTDDSLTLLQSALQQQRQAQQEAFQTGLEGSLGQETTQETSHHGGGGHKMNPDQTSQLADQTGDTQADAKKTKSRASADDGTTDAPISDEETSELADQSGDMQADEKRQHGARSRKSQLLGQDANVSDYDDEENRGADGATIGVDADLSVAGAGSVIGQEKIDAQQLKATYHFATNEQVYTPPVNANSIEKVFIPENQKAAHAIPVVRSLELSAITGNIQPSLEPKGHYAPLVQFEDNGIHGGQIEYGAGVEA